MDLTVRKPKPITLLKFFHTAAALPKPKPKPPPPPAPTTVQLIALATPAEKADTSLPDAPPPVSPLNLEIRSNSRPASPKSLSTTGTCFTQFYASSNQTTRCSQSPKRPRFLLKKNKSRKMSSQSSKSSSAVASPSKSPLSSKAEAKRKDKGKDKAKPEEDTIIEIASARDVARAYKKESLELCGEVMKLVQAKFGFKHPPKCSPAAWRDEVLNLVLTFLDEPDVVGDEDEEEQELDEEADFEEEEVESEDIDEEEIADEESEEEEQQDEE